MGPATSNTTLQVMLLVCLAFVFIQLSLLQEPLADSLSVSSSASRESMLEMASRLRNTTGTAKPRLIFHIGPPKTATKSTQFDLWTLREALQRDNYYYAGKGWLYEKKLVPRSAIAQELFDLYHHSEKDSPGTTKSLSKLRRLLEPYRQSNTNVIMSEEAVIKRLKSSQHYRALKDGLGNEWDILVVLGYCPFYKWAHSKMFQRNRLNRAETWHDEWPGVKNGKELELIFPNIALRWSDYWQTRDFTTDAIAFNNGTLPIRILDVDEVAPFVTTHLLCNLLDPVPVHACQASKERDKTQDVTRHNGQDYGIICHEYYDMLTTAAANKGWIDQTLFGRPQVRDSVRSFQEKRLNLTFLEFDLKCPPQHDMEAFFQDSLAKDKLVRIYTKGAAVYTKENEQAFRRSFMEKVHEKAFCWVDADAVLSREPWERFFQQYRPRTPR